MQLAYLTDQVLPQTATDTTQLVSMASAFAGVQREIGGGTTIVLPRSWMRHPASSQRIAEAYSVAGGFNVAPVRSIYPNIRGIEKLAQGWRAPASAAAQRADVLYTRTLPILISSLVLNAGPIVYETYRPWPIQNSYSHEIFRWIGNHPLFLGAVLHSEYARNSYAEIGVSGDKLLTALNGYDPALVSPRLRRSEARGIVGWQADEKCVVYSGRITARKGLDVVLEIAARMPDVRFVLLGSEGRGEVETAASKLSNVDVLGWRSMPETLPYLFAADVLLIPPSMQPLKSAGNTVLPIKTFLYLATGRPILAGCTPDLTEILQDGRNARLVEPDNATEAVSALHSLLQDATARDSLGQNALESVKNLTWDARARRILAFIQDRLSI